MHEFGLSLRGFAPRVPRVGADAVQVKVPRLEQQQQQRGGGRAAARAGGGYGGDSGAAAVAESRTRVPKRAHPSLTDTSAFGMRKEPRRSAIGACEGRGPR